MHARRRPSHPARSVPVAVACLAKLLREPASRALFTRASGVSLLAPLLKTVAGAHLLLVSGPLQGSCNSSVAL